MKAKPYKLECRKFIPCSPEEATHVRLSVPGPFEYRMLPLSGIPSWTWNKDTEKPTLTPSILTSAELGPERKKVVCHSFVTDGMIQFLTDCTHGLAGQTVPLLDVD